ncbi:MAG TPA: peptidase domain-containing ABC transporter [Chitinophagaceae bacterium]|nr:peptidase domain-containing ABC transporter [Chitinophagaceae bacterium]
MTNFPHFTQLDMMDCGPTCLRMISKYYGKNFSPQTLRNKSQVGKDGVNLLGISEAAESIGFKSIGVKLSYEELFTEANLPCILHWNKNHFVVLPPQKNGRFKSKKTISIADPALQSVIEIDNEVFKRNWLSTREGNEEIGTALLLETTNHFYDEPGEKHKGTSFERVIAYFLKYKSIIAQVLVAVMLTTLFQLALPFLTQGVVDFGIYSHDVGLVYLLLIGQFVLHISRFIVDFIRNRLLLYISTRVNISILSDFWIKMMNLPISFFDQKQTGDILQRIQDQNRIQQFMTQVALGSLFGILTLIVYSFVLLYYNPKVYLIFIIGSIIYILWIRMFLSYRRKVDYEQFDLSSKENNVTMQLVQGMQDIKLNGCEKHKRWQWEMVQTQLFQLNLKNFNITQFQQSGALIINQTKDILITLIVAQSVIKGELTLGTMLAIQYIIGQLSSPIQQIIDFVQSGQSAKISLERLNEIMDLDNEEMNENPAFASTLNDHSIQMSNLHFTYSGAGNEAVLKNININIPQHKTTAIVGASGSGKTTLIKLLLRFYDPTHGDIFIGSEDNRAPVNLKNLSHRDWRRNIGVVMQEGYIFSDTIANNIAIGDENPNIEKLIESCRIANILEFVQGLPLGLNTKIGAEGNGISSGQRQRLLIARAVYKNPAYIFLDEATNSLDATNELIIIENLKQFFKNRTVVVVAHRLSTVKNADNIIVLNHGMIAEQGTHVELTARKGVYYELVKNQLELGN